MFPVLITVPDYELIKSIDAPLIILKHCHFDTVVDSLSVEHKTSHVVTDKFRQDWHLPPDDYGSDTLLVLHGMSVSDTTTSHKFNEVVYQHLWSDDDILLLRRPLWSKIDDDSPRVIRRCVVNLG